MINDLTTYSQSFESVTGQDPDNITWLDPSHWSNSTWDGIPLSDPQSKTAAELCSFLRPSSVYVIKGLREKFYSLNPFNDVTNPTVEEIEYWNLEVIKHIRALLGNTTPINYNARLFLEATWASERKHTEIWDTKYPNGVPGASSGPCWLSGNPVDTAGGHCGASFFPNQSDRSNYISNAPYLEDFTKYPELENYTLRYSQAEGVTNINANLPWSIKLGFVITNWICSEGLSGHAGPYVGFPNAREEIGISWWYSGGSNVSFRGKFR